MTEPLPEEFLIERGYCCAHGCHNRPYRPKHGGTTVLREEVQKRLKSATK